jgi:hypothetical protein
MHQLMPAFLGKACNGTCSAFAGCFSISVEHQHSSSSCSALHNCLVTSLGVLRAVVRTDDGRTLLRSFTNTELKHTCGNGRFPCVCFCPFCHRSKLVLPCYFVQLPVAQDFVAFLGWQRQFNVDSPTCLEFAREQCRCKGATGPCLHLL